MRNICRYLLKEGISIRPVFRIGRYFEPIFVYVVFEPQNSRTFGTLGYCSKIPVFYLCYCICNPTDTDIRFLSNANYIAVSGKSPSYCKLSLSQQ